MGRRKPGLDVRSRAGSAWGGSAYPEASVVGLAGSRVGQFHGRFVPRGDLE